MANTVALLGTPTPNRCVFLLTSDGTGSVVQPITNATLLAAMVAGPLKDLWNATYADQAAMRLALMVNSASIRTQLRAVVNDTTGEKNQCLVDVDTDATTPTKAELNFGMSDTAAQEALLVIEHVHSVVE
jgi:hypothetical protein